MKFCKDCIHYKRVGYDSICLKIETEVKIEEFYDPVTGKELPTRTYEDSPANCYKVRANEKLCGKEAKWYEKIQSI